MKTLLLNPVSWDLMIDSDGNIAVASDPFSLAQDAASAIKLFQGELWFDTTQGIPYFTQIFGKPPNINLIKAQFGNAALTVPGVIAVTVYITSIIDRNVNGQVQVTDATGVTTAANF